MRGVPGPRRHFARWLMSPSQVVVRGTAGHYAVHPHVAADVCRHLNHDHSEDLLLIVRTLGHVPDAYRAAAIDVDAEGLSLTASTHRGQEQTRVVFTGVAADRAGLQAALEALRARAFSVASDLGPNR
jgi:hypothetical protein